MIGMQLKKYFTYIARCADNSLYTGITNNVTAREKKHNAGSGARYTRSRRPVKIIYSEEYLTRSDAAKREAQLKGWTKIKKENLVHIGNPKKSTL